jgi:hypothetical protein
MAVLSVFGFVLASVPTATAHHSFCAEYDSNKPFSLTGKVAKVEWVNPHSWLYLDVADDKGGFLQWPIHVGKPPHLLAQDGWTRDTLKASDEVTVRLAPAKSGVKMAGLLELTFKGKKLFSVDFASC